MSHYKSQDEIKIGDVVRINNERYGRVVTIISDENSLEGGYYFRQFGPGVLFNFDGWGDAYYPLEDIPDDEDLFLVSRSPTTEA